MIDGITRKYTCAPTLYRIALMTRPLNFSKWLAISAATIAAVDRHLARLGLYPRSDFEGLAPVASPPPTDGCFGPHHTPPLLYSTAAAPAPLQYTSAGLAPVAQPPPTDGCCGPLHTLLRPCSSAPPTDGCCGPHHTLFRPRTVHCRGPRSHTVLCCTAAPGSGHLGGFHRPHCVAAAANASSCHGQSRDLCRPCCTAAPGSGHLAFSRPPAPPVALGATNGRTTARSYAKLTKTLISTLKTSAFKTKMLISTLKTSAFKTKTLISTPKTIISTPESIMPTSLYLQPRGFREIRLPSSYSLSLRLTLAVSTPVVSFRSTHHSVCIVCVCV